MALLKTRPKIELFVPRVVAIGRRFQAEVRLHAEADVEVEHVHVDLRCRAGWTQGSGKYQVSRYDDLLGLRAQPFAGAVLTRGDHTFRSTFELPAELPPSYVGGGASANWSIDVEVSIPWWPDARSKHAILVHMPDAQLHDAVPARFRQATTDLRAPRIEASLTSSVLAPGGRVAGAIALYNFDPGSAHAIRIGLVERNLLRGRRGGANLRPGRSWFVRAESAAGPHERGTPFEFLIPPDAVPTFDCPAFSHSYVLEIQVKTGLLSSSTLTIPLTLTNDTTLKDESLRLAVPSVGASRMAELGREVAARRGYTIDGASLTRTIDAAGHAIDLDLSHDTRAGEGTFLVATLAFPRLGLALSVEPQTGIAGFFARDVEIEQPEWDRRHRVAARDPQQAIPFLRALVSSLGADATFTALGDESARLADPDPTLSAQSLDAFAAKVERVAMALGQAIAHVPPPSTIDPGPSWPELATRLRGRFVIGDLAIDDGKLGTTEVTIETRWDDGGVHRIELVPDPPIPEEASMVLASPVAEATTVPGLSAEVRAVLTRLPEGARDLRIGAGRVSVELPFDASGPTPRARPTDVSNVVDLLARLGPLFGVRRGPFR